jgi:hypothetical protein
MFDDLFSLESRVDYVTTQIRQHVSKIHQTGNKLNFACPLCDDAASRKRRGFYYTDTDTYWCFNGGCEANEGILTGFNFIAKMRYVDVSEIKREYVSSLKDIVGILKNGQTHKPQEASQSPPKQKEPSLDIPDEWVDPPKDVEGYIHSRMLHMAPNAHGMKLYWNCKTGRIIIPHMEYGKLVYWQERNIPGASPKYLFPKNLDKQMYGLRNISEDFEYIYILEGVFDSVFVKNGIAMGGNKPTSAQMDHLKNRYMNHETVLMLDNPNADATAKAEIVKIAAARPNQKIFLWPKTLMDKDVNDYVKRTKDVDKFFNPDFLRQNTHIAIKASIIEKMRKSL